MNSFVIKKLKLEDNGCIEKGSWDIVSTPVDLHNAEKPYGSGWTSFSGDRTWEIKHSSITEHPTDPKTFSLQLVVMQKERLLIKTLLFQKTLIEVLFIK